MFKIKNLFRDIINLVGLIFTGVLIFKFVFIFIHQNNIRIIIFIICNLISFWLFLESRDENRKSVGKFLSDKLIKENEKVSAIKILIFLVFLRIIISIFDFLINLF